LRIRLRYQIPLVVLGLVTSSPAIAQIVNVAPRGYAAEATSLGPRDATAAIDDDLTTTYSTDAAASEPGIFVDLREGRRVVRVVVHWGASKPHDVVVACANWDCGPGRWYHTVAGENISVIEGEGITELFVARIMFLRFVPPPGGPAAGYDVREVELQAPLSSSMLAGRILETAAGPIMRAATDGDPATMATIPSNELTYTRVDGYFTAEIDRIVLSWGSRFPSSYRVEIGCGEAPLWIHHESNGDGGVDVINTGTVEDNCIRVFADGDSGAVYDLGEIDVFGRGSLDQADQAPAVATSTSGANLPDHVTDRDMSTEWRSEPSSSGTALLIDIGGAYGLVRVVTHWGDSFPTEWALFISEDGTTFEPAFGTNRGDGGVDQFDIGYEYQLYRRARYLLLVMPPSDTGYSIRQVEVYKGFFG
jgi:hypothetical protein